MGRYYTVNPKRGKDGLTNKERDFADRALEVGQSAAAKEVFPELAEPDSKASRLMKRPDVSSYMSEVLDAKGATRERCAENIAEKIGSDDSKASLKATEMALRVHGELKESAGTTINFLTPESFDLFIAKLNDKPA